MIDAIVRFSIERRLLMLSMLLVVVAAGVWGYQRLPIDAVPDVTNVQVQVLTNAPSLGPVEVEQYVTVPVETVMSGLPGVAISPRSAWRWATKPVSGETMLAWLAEAAAAQALRKKLEDADAELTAMTLALERQRQEAEDTLTLLAAAEAIRGYIKAQGIEASGLNIAFDAPSATVTVDGNVPDQATKEKILLCCGNVAGVEKVNDMMTVQTPAPEAQYHTVVRGDTLSAIAKKFYGNANKYPVIFEANKPMLQDPDKIYPGQVLRIPPQ